VGGIIGAVGTFKTRLFKPKWSAEIIAVHQRIWKYVTDTACLGDFFALDPTKIPWVYLLVITLPCEDFSTSGKQRGDMGPTGWMLMAAVHVVLAMPTLPKIVEFETADGVLVTHNGRELKAAEAAMGGKFVVHRRMIKVADYGSPSHRKRIVLVCTRIEPTAYVPWDMPPPTWGPHRPLCAADVAVPDAQVPESKKCFTEELKIRYDLDCCQPAARFGEMMRIGRVAPGMGLSWNPHLCIHWPGSWNGPKGYGGGGTFPPQD
jgi:site-specific DNA-cytosine methylase